METELELRERRMLHIAHCNFRRGLSDYNDGSSLNHNLGNDDYKENNLPDEGEFFDKDRPGYEALGNDLTLEEYTNVQ